MTLIILSIAIIVVSLAAVAVGRVPRLRMNRATIALVAAVALVLAGALSLEQAYAALDLNTLVLLLAVMVINGNLRISGFFRLAAERIVNRARSPRQFLALVVGASGILSALFLNDTIVLVFTPLVAEIALRAGRNPVPYLIALAASANVGSAATIIGNPQNILIGSASGIPFLTFTAHLAPVAAGGLIIVWLVVGFVYRKEFAPEGRFRARSDVRFFVYRPLLLKSLSAAGLMLVAFIAGAPVPLAALVAAALLLITRRLKPERIFREVDWSLLVFFSGLFVITRAIETTGVSGILFQGVWPLAGRGIVSFSAAAALLSNLVSNVPAVMLFRPLVSGLADPGPAWLTLAMASTLAGNLTLLGSVANLIMAERARKHGVRVSFLEYLKAGVPITILSLIWGILCLSVTTG
ncbi:MAG: anion transporter [PVC group bacterium]